MWKLIKNKEMSWNLLLCDDDESGSKLPNDVFKYRVWWISEIRKQPLRNILGVPPSASGAWPQIWNREAHDAARPDTPDLDVYNSP
jgi:hypothetical protein